MKYYFNFYFSLNDKYNLQRSEKPPLHATQLAYIPIAKKIIEFTRRTRAILNPSPARFGLKDLGRYKRYVTLRCPSGYTPPSFWKSQLDPREYKKFQHTLNAYGLPENLLLKRWENEHRNKPDIEDYYTTRPPSISDRHLRRIIVEGIEP